MDSAVKKGSKGRISCLLSCLLAVMYQHTGDRQKRSAEYGGRMLGKAEWLMQGTEESTAQHIRSGKACVRAVPDSPTHQLTIDVAVC